MTKDDPAFRSAAWLKDKLHACPSGTGMESWRIRLHRAISWLGRAEREAEDPDACFIFLWIAFNAAYARELGIEEPFRKELAAFLSSVTALDREGRLHRILFKDFSGPVRTLIANRYVFEPFWRALREQDGSEHWKTKLEKSQKAAMRAVLDAETPTVLGIVFDRLYVLRNQLVHGGATWASQINRDQVKDGTRILMSLVPVILDLMLDHPEADFGNILYPVVGQP